MAKKKLKPFKVTLEFSRIYDMQGFLQFIRRHQAELEGANVLPENIMPPSRDDIAFGWSLPDKPLESFYTNRCLIDSEKQSMAQTVLLFRAQYDHLLLLNKLCKALVRVFEGQTFLSAMDREAIGDYIQQIAAELKKEKKRKKEKK